ncbi:DMT family transporter [Saliniramus sp.]|uniref:DMT family transporter n=1 Tax=Saliniramus sp. TaxID=2986772 RepID=UPI002BF0FF49|nr:DMT family transporter [Saliniramus sp.]HMB09168.1 DMT family transporter [Saliniramus sp.]
MAATGSRPDDLNKAVLYMVFAASLIPMLNASAKYLTEDYSVLQITWARYAGHFVYMLMVFVPYRGLALLRSQQIPLQLLRSSLLCMATLIYITALAFVPLTTAAAISFTAPFIVTTFAPVILGERVSLRRWIAITVGFAGALIVIRPGEGMNLAALLVFGSAASAAFYQLLSRKLAAGDPADTSITYIAVTGFLLTSLPLPFIWQTPGSLLDWLLFASLGFFGGFGHYFLVRAFEVAPAPFVSPFNYLQLAGAVLLGWMVFGQLPDLFVWLGSAIIIGSGVYILYSERAKGIPVRTGPVR